MRTIAYLLTLVLRLGLPHVSVLDWNVVNSLLSLDPRADKRDVSSACALFSSIADVERHRPSPRWP